MKNRHLCALPSHAYWRIKLYIYELMVSGLNALMMINWFYPGLMMKITVSVENIVHIVDVVANVF